MSKYQYDWQDPSLQAAAVEYAWGQCGGRPSGGAALAAWHASLVAAAAALGLPAWRDLERWMADDRYKPESAKGGYAEDDESVISREAAPVDMLEGLLREEDDTLCAAERAELVSILEAGAVLSSLQRTTLAVMLRGSAFATRSDIFSRMVQFLCPAEKRGRSVWKVVRSRIRVPSAGGWQHVATGMVVDAFPVLGASRLEVVSASGEVVAVRLFARVIQTRGRDLDFRQLVPSEEFASGLVARRMAVMESFCDPSRPGEGKKLAALFGQSAANVSYERHSLADRVKEETSGKAGFTGLRNKRQANFGKKKTKTNNHEQN